MAVVREERWRGRPVASAALRAFVFAAPIAAALVTSILVARPLVRAGTHAPLRYGVAFLASTVVLVAVDRGVRRLLPLAVLLRLSLAFPGEAPSRLKVARSAASVRDLERRVERARRAGVADEPARAAAQILALVAAVESHDRHTRGHSERVRVYVDMIAAELKLAPDDRDRLRWAALLHDVGKLEVPRSVLRKPGPLSPEEWSAVHQHPDAGARLIAPLRPWLGVWAATVEQHHERWDGGGYPRRIAGREICLGARVTAVADSYETMTGSRPYHRAMTPGRARSELVRCSGSQFDPQIVRAFLQVSVRRIRLVSGPLSWLLQTPLIRALEQAASVAGRAATAAATAGGAAVLAFAPATLPGGLARASAPADVRAAFPFAPALPAASPEPSPLGLDDGSPFEPVADGTATKPTASPSPGFYTGQTLEAPEPCPSPGSWREGEPSPRPSPCNPVPGRYDGGGSSGAGGSQDTGSSSETTDSGGEASGGSSTGAGTSSSLGFSGGYETGKSEG